MQPSRRARQCGFRTIGARLNAETCRAAAQGFQKVNAAWTRAQILPPSDLNALEKQEFIAVVTGSLANHFLPADIATLASLVPRAVVTRGGARPVSWTASRS